MGGPPFLDAFPARGHGPSSFGGAGSQFPSRFEDVQHDFSKLDIDEMKEKDGGAHKAKSIPRVSFNTTTKGTPRHYEYYEFKKRDDWSVADRVKIAAPQEELEKTVSRGKKSSSVLESLKKMSPDRRAQVDRLLDQKNLNEESKDTQWHCVFIDSPNPKDKDIGGKRIREHKTMNVVVAQHILPGRAKSTSHERSKSFVGERSDVTEPLKVKDKAKDKDKQSKGGKESKDGKDHLADPFDSNKLFNDHGVPLDKHGPIPGYPPQPPRFDQGMGQPFGPPGGQPFGPPGGQPMGAFQPTGPAYNPMYGDPFTQPSPGQKLPHGIEILGDPIPPQNGANNVFNLDDLLTPEQGPTHPHDQHPQFQRPHLNNFQEARAPPRKPANRPFIIQDPPKGRRDYTKKWMNDDSSRESDDEFPFFEEDERSSHTSYGDDHEKLVRRGSLVPHRRSSVKRREPTYREHHRGSSYPLEQPQRRQEPRRDSRYNGDRVETIIERRPRRHSSRERREAIRYVQPKQLEYQSRSPPLTPISNSSYSPSRRFSGLPYPHELERDRDHERFAEEYIREKHIRDREEALQRRERDLEDRDFFERSGFLDRLGERVSGQDRYHPSRR